MQKILRITPSQKVLLENDFIIYTLIFGVFSAHFSSIFITFHRFQPIFDPFKKLLYII